MKTTWMAVRAAVVVGALALGWVPPASADGATKAEASRPSADKANPETDKTKPEADKTKSEGDKTKSEGDKAKSEGDKTKAEGDKAKPVTEKEPARREFDPNRVGVVREFAPGSPDATLREAFKCALEMGDAAGFECYAALNVDGNHDNDIATGQLRNYQWRWFRQRAASYVIEDKDKTFGLKVTRRDPARLEPNTKEVKIFLFSTARDNPTPVILRREAGSWRIYANSL